MITLELAHLKYIIIQLLKFTKNLKLYRKKKWPEINLTVMHIPQLATRPMWEIPIYIELKRRKSAQQII